MLGQTVVSDSLRPPGLSLTKLLCPWNSCPGKNAEVGSHSLLQGIFVTRGLNPGPPPCRRILYRLSHQSSPDVLHGIGSVRSSQQRALCRAVPASGLSPGHALGGNRGLTGGLRPRELSFLSSTQAWMLLHAALRTVGRQLTRTHILPSGVGDCLENMPSLTLTVFSVFFQFEPNDPVANIWRAALGWVWVEET